MKKKIDKIKRLEVNSFVTSLEYFDSQTVKGGNQSAWCPPPTAGCQTNANCSPGAPTSTVDEEICHRTMWDPYQCNL